MSSVTSKFFDDKTPEEIINWMLDKLSEDQIRMCLDQAGIPDTSVIETPDEPTPVPMPMPMPAPTSSISLNELRRSCRNRLILIDSIQDNYVNFYEYIPKEETIIGTIISDGEEGDLVWVESRLNVQEFMDSRCNEIKISESNEILDLDADDLASMAPSLVNNFDIPKNIKTIANVYKNLGLPQPINENLLDDDVIPSVPTSSQMYDETIKEFIRMQLGLENVLMKNYMSYYEKGLKKFPVFIYNVSPDQKISYISLELTNDNSFNFKQRKNGKTVLLPQIKKDMKELTQKIETAKATGWDEPDDYRELISNALMDWSDKSTENKEIYNNILVNYTPERLDEIKNTLTTAYGISVESEYYNSPDLMSSEMNFGDNYSTRPSPIPGSGEKNARDLSMGDLNKRMVTLFGKEYANTHEPHVTTNKFGIKTVQYRKKAGAPEVPIVLDTSFKDNYVFNNFGTSSDAFDLF